MRRLKILLRAKIIGTAVLWCLPLVAFPASLFIQLGFPAPEPMMFARLLGAAYLALLVGYYMGIRALDAGASTATVCCTGVTSNGLTFAVLAFYGCSGEWSAWGSAAQIFMWVSTAGAFFIAACLIYFGTRHPC